MREPLPPLRVGSARQTLAREPRVLGDGRAPSAGDQTGDHRLAVPEDVALTCVVGALAVGVLEVEASVLAHLLAVLGERIDGPALWNAAGRDGRVRVRNDVGARPQLQLCLAPSPLDRRWEVAAEPRLRAASLIPWVLQPRSIVVAADVGCACESTSTKCRCRPRTSGEQAAPCGCFAGRDLLHAALRSWFRVTPTSIVVDRHLNWKLAGGAADGGIGHGSGGFASAARLCCLAAETVAQQATPTTRELGFLLVTTPAAVAQDERARQAAEGPELVRAASADASRRTSGSRAAHARTQEALATAVSPYERARLLAHWILKRLPGWSQTRWELDDRSSVRVSLLLPRQVHRNQTEPHDRWLLSGSGTRALHAGASFDRADHNRRPAPDHFVLTIHDLAHTPPDGIEGMLQAAQSARAIRVGRFTPRAQEGSSSPGRAIPTAY